MRSDIRDIFGTISDRIVEQVNGEIACHMGELGSIGELNHIDVIAHTGLPSVFDDAREAGWQATFAFANLSYLIRVKPIPFVAVASILRRETDVVTCSVD
jgi:hypothetical protein